MILTFCNLFVGDDFITCGSYNHNTCTCMYNVVIFYVCVYFLYELQERSELLKRIARSCWLLLICYSYLQSHLCAVTFSRNNYIHPIVLVSLTFNLMHLEKCVWESPFCQLTKFFSIPIYMYVCMLYFDLSSDNDSNINIFQK